MKLVSSIFLILLVLAISSERVTAQAISRVDATYSGNFLQTLTITGTDFADVESVVLDTAVLAVTTSTKTTIIANATPGQMLGNSRPAGCSGAVRTGNKSA
jgi:hypothetical protein